MKIQFFWHITTYDWYTVNRLGLLGPEDDGTTIPRSVGDCLRVDTA